MIARALALLLLSLPIFAQGTDIAVEIQGDETTPTLFATYAVRAVWSGSESPQNAVLEVDLPGEIYALYQWDPETRCTGTRPVRCTLPAVPSHDGGFTASVIFPAAGTYTATARVTSTTPDPRPDNNTATQTTRVTGLPWLVASVLTDFDTPGPVEPGRPTTTRIAVQNRGETATNVILRAALPEGGSFVSAAYQQGEHATCSVTPQEVVCTIPVMRREDHTVVLVEYIPPSRDSGGTFPLVASASSAEADHDPAHNVDVELMTLRRLFHVTHTGDDGAGSLRQAIVDTRVFCETEACSIRIPAEIGAIQPLAPLPRLRGRVKVDGGILDGTLQPFGDGLFYEGGCELHVTNMVIRNFQGHAIDAQAGPQPQACDWYLQQVPVTVTNNELTGNLRGVMIGHLSASITNNKIRGNRRAGIFANGGYYTEVGHNELIGNGASGVFINPPHATIAPLPPGAHVYENLIRDNGEWGITRAGGGAVHFEKNSIFNNVLMGIDVGLDLEQPAPEKPVLLSAVYDPASGETIVRGRTNPEGARRSSQLDFFASSSLSRWAFPQAERWLLQTHHGEGDFEVALPGDLRGQWITATGTRQVAVLFLRHETDAAEPAPRADARPRYSANDTSELSNAVLVH